MNDEQRDQEVLRLTQRVIDLENKLNSPNESTKELFQRVETLEEARKRQITLNSTFLTAPQTEKKPIKWNKFW